MPARWNAHRARDDDFIELIVAVLVRYGGADEQRDEQRCGAKRQRGRQEAIGTCYLESPC